tara:strand:+ start:19809 stop:20231 length:423 start_codon:yes stop_codon:yes gene_type:complete
MEELYLIYINKIGIDWEGNGVHEFIFSDTIEDVDGDDWDAVPASGLPSGPNKSFVKRVGKITFDKIELKLIQESDSNSVWDAVDKVIALGYENIEAYEEYPEFRLRFFFGDTMELVEKRLLEKDLVLQYNNEIKTIFDED